MLSKKWNLGPHPSNSFEVIVFFDRASQEGGNLCGASNNI